MKMGKRALVLTLSVLMMFSTLPVSVFAGDEGAPAEEPKQVEVQEPVKETKPEPPAEPKEEAAPEAPAAEPVAEPAAETPKEDTDTDKQGEAEQQEQTSNEVEEEGVMLTQAGTDEPELRAEADTVDVTFYATEGTIDGAPSKTIQVTKGDYVRRPDFVPTTTNPKLGFRGWVSEADYNAHNWGNYYSFNSANPVNEDTNIYAVWGTATLQYGVESGSQGRGSVYIDDDESTLTEALRPWSGPVGSHTLHAIPKEGFAFYRWVSVSGTIRNYNKDYTVNLTDGHDTIYAQFISAEEVIYSITYSPGAGTGSIAPRAIQAKDNPYTIMNYPPEYSAPAYPAVETNYTFDKWEVKIGDADPVYKNPGDQVNITADTTITAIYRKTPTHVEVRPTREGGTDIWYQSVSITGPGVTADGDMAAYAERETEVAVTITPKTGYKVKRVVSVRRDTDEEVGNQDNYSTTISDDGVGTTTYTANSEGAYIWLMFELEPLPNLTVTFESNGGSDVTDQTVVWGKQATKPDNPTKDGFVFKGWYSDEALSNEYDFSSSVRENTTLYAKWSKVVLTFDPNGGTMNGSTSPVTMECAPGEEITIPDAPTRDGYEFQYWEGSQYYPGDKYTVTEEDHKFTAVWKEVSKADDSEEDSDTTDDSDTSKSSNKTSKKSKGVDTGDAAGLMGWLLLGIAAEAGAVYMYRRRREY